MRLLMSTTKVLNGHTQKQCDVRYTEMEITISKTQRLIAQNLEPESVPRV
jgi:hypothetical protein